MKILAVCQHYYPEPMRLPDICEELVKRGHEVDVITGVPNYPMGIIYDGYRKGERRDECINGVNVHRCFTIGRRHGVLFRVLNYYSFSISSTLYAARLKKDYDVVFVNQLSPVMMANAGIKYKKKHKKKLVLYSLDLWPESLVAGGIKRGGLVYRLFDKISRRIYRSADRILVTSKNFISYFRSHFDIDDSTLDYMPQYSEDLFSPLPAQADKSSIDFTFAGNIGAMQSVETIIKAAASLKDIENLYIHIVGDGSSLDECKNLAGSLGADNVIFHGRRPLEDMPEFYRQSDAMLVTLAGDPLISMTLPGKVQTYMAAGKPIIGAIDGEAAKIISDANCGYCGPAEDPDALAENIRRFIESDREQFGKNALEYYQKNFTKEKFMTMLEEELRAASTSSDEG